MKPKTQVIIGNWAGGLCLVSLLLALIGAATETFSLMFFFVPFIAGMMVRMLMDHRQDRIRIAPDGEIYLNGRLTSVEGVLQDLPLDDPHLAMESIESRIASSQNNLLRRGPAAYRPQINWFLWVDREYDPDHVPEQAVSLIALLQKHDVPFACTWKHTRPAKSSAGV